MRNVLCQALVERAADPDFVFLTGDLGYQALEPLRDVMGRRFINAGVAEQNMVAVAAGLARSGLRPWVYSIAPFVYARPFEQIRNDVCLHNLPVMLIGNGGGYGYGVMGGTHHAIEDYGVLLSLLNMQVFVPAFAGDVRVMIEKLAYLDGPAYLRLGSAEEPKEFPLPAYAPWRRILTGSGPTLLVVGPLAGSLLAALSNVDERQRPSLWVLTELPIAEPPVEFLEDLRRSGHLYIVEEHVARGSAGQIIAHHLLTHGAAPPRFTHRTAQGYPSGLYGSQKFHRRECGLDPETVLAELLQVEAV
jgi:transketolase